MQQIFCSGHFNRIYGYGSITVTACLLCFCSLSCLLYLAGAHSITNANTSKTRPSFRLMPNRCNTSITNSVSISIPLTYMPIYAVSKYILIRSIFFSLLSSFSSFFSLRWRNNHVCAVCVCMVLGSSVCMWFFDIESKLRTKTHGQSQHWHWEYSSELASSTTAFILWCWVRVCAQNANAMAKNHPCELNDVCVCLAQARERERGKKWAKRP